MNLCLSCSRQVFVVSSVIVNASNKFLFRQKSDNKFSFYFSFLTNTFISPTNTKVLLLRCIAFATASKCTAVLPITLSF